MITQEDIAKELNISRATVSRALNGYEVSEKTKRKVLNAAKQLGYVQNNAAVSLALKRNKIIHAFLTTSIEDAYDTEFREGIDTLIKTKTGYKFQIEIHYTDIKGKEEQSKQQLELFQEIIKTEIVDGIILCPLSQENLDIISKECKLRSIPLMTVDTIYEGNQLCHVGPSYYKIGAISANLVASLIQCKGSVLSIEYDEGYNINNERFKGFYSKIKEYKDISITKCKLEAISREAYQKTLDEQWKKNSFDAIFAPVFTNYVAEWLEGKGLTDKVVVVANDRNESIQEYVKNGCISAILHQKPFYQGYFVAGNFFRYFFSKEDFQSGVIDTGTDILIQENIN